MDCKHSIADISMKITLDRINHNNASRMEFFLNSLQEELTEVPFDWKSLKLSDLITDACKFTSASNNNSLTITAFFCNSYFEANDIAKANAFPTTEKARWSVNGDLLYIVECDDEQRVVDVLGVFAGEE